MFFTQFIDDDFGEALEVLAAAVARGGADVGEVDATLGLAMMD